VSLPFILRSLVPNGAQPWLNKNAAELRYYVDSVAFRVRSAMPRTFYLKSPLSFEGTHDAKTPGQNLACAPLTSG